MGKKKKGSTLFRIETLFVAIFFLSFIIWSAERCNSRKKAEQVEAQAVLEQRARDSLKNVAQGQEKSTDPQQRIIKEKYTPLYVTLDGLNMRTGPTLDSPVIIQLKLGEEVEFLNEVTDSTLRLRLSETEWADEPWVKIKHRKGHTGWVYGAGVNYYQ